MRHPSVALFVCLFLVSGWGVVTSLGQANEAGPGNGTKIALDLTDLEIPGEGGGDEMELPPIQGTEEREEEPVPPAPPGKPAEVEQSKTDIPDVGTPSQSSEGGMVPFLLEEPEVGYGTTGSGIEPTREPVPETPSEAFPAELKTVPPPPSRAESLKLPAGMDTSGADRSDVPEIPLLKGEEWGEHAPAPTGQDSSLTMKPLPDLRRIPDTGRQGGSSPQDRRPEDYLQVHEDIDARLIDLFERYYKDR